MVHDGATELLICNVGNDIFEHGDNLAYYYHNDITGVLNPAQGWVEKSNKNIKNPSLGKKNKKTKIPW